MHLRAVFDTASLPRDRLDSSSPGSRRRLYTSPPYPAQPQAWRGLQAISKFARRKKIRRFSLDTLVGNLHVRIDKMTTLRAKRGFNQTTICAKRDDQSPSPG